MMKTFTTKSRSQTVADFQNSQTRLAEASALVESVELLLQRDARETMAICASRQLTIEERLHDGNALLRSFRDAHAIGMHLGNNGDVAGPLYGSVMLGRLPSSPIF
jgi:hypothetical protein